MAPIVLASLLQSKLVVVARVKDVWDHPRIEPENSSGSQSLHFIP